MSSESTIASSPDEADSPHFPEVIFPAGNSDFRAVRNRCAQACREFNNTPDDADPEERSQKWLDIVRPDRDRTEDRVLAVTHDQTFANPTLQAKTPFVKPPVYIDYGIRLHVGGSTFINRNCMIMDTPVADVVIGEGCNIGPNCCIIGVTHPVRLDERLQKHSIGQPVRIGDNVWIGANVTILGGVTIGSGAVIGACSLIKRDVPPMTVAFGVPARVVCSVSDVKPTPPGTAVVTHTLEEAKGLANRLPLPGKERRRRGEEEEEEEEEEGLVDYDLFDLGIDDGDAVDDDDEDEDGSHADERGVLCRRATPQTRRRFSVGSGSTAHSGLLRAGARERLNIARVRNRQCKTLPLRRRCRQHRRWTKVWALEAVVGMTVVIALLVLFFLVGLYLGANKLAHKGSGPGPL
ncbi:trimeric LpxA-like protein [Corynascus novoguineensis]|uniref:Trimeric LpxA-like protein n=1 Tax=Corynascus novoguineensis TaxID=1126955 RepID=A0AAN7CUG5_9PEZI|nr:trimeric LpxA-like protein [Corynascus novoguineensis]